MQTLRRTALYPQSLASQYHVTLGSDCCCDLVQRELSKIGVVEQIGPDKLLVTSLCTEIQITAVVQRAVKNLKQAG